MVIVLMCIMALDLTFTILNTVFARCFLPRRVHVEEQDAVVLSLPRLIAPQGHAARAPPSL